MKIILHNIYKIINYIYIYTYIYIYIYRNIFFNINLSVYVFYRYFIMRYVFKKSNKIRSVLKAHIYKINALYYIIII